MTSYQSGKLGLPLSKILRAQKNANNVNFKRINVKVISEVTFEPLDKIISFFLADYQLLPIFQVGGFDQLNHQIINLEKEEKNSFEFIYVHNSALKVFAKSNGMQRVNTADAFEQVMNDYIQSIKRLIDVSGSSTIILNLFELPPYRIRGSHSTRSGIIKITQAINSQILSLCNDNKNVLIHDANYISANIGLANWYDFGSWVSFKQPFSGLALKSFGASIASVIASYLGRSKKLLITDFDNTLWGGVIGETGAEGVEIGVDSPKGEIFSLVQSYIYDLMESGVIIAACSKNEEKNVQSAFEKSSSHLLMEDFSSKKINWSQKSKNIIEIINELNISEESAVFIDDNPAEILEVSGNVKGCSCVSYESIAVEMMQSIDALGFFETQTVNKDDLNRIQSYKKNTYRKESSLSFGNYNDFLKSLEMEATMFWNTSNNVERLISLNNKTNQFNTNQLTLSASEVVNYIEAVDKFILSVDLNDKFGPLGVISTMFGELIDDKCVIANWVMSCRVFKRDLEQCILSSLLEKLRDLQINSIHASIKYSTKNAYCREVFKEFGFKEVNSTSGGKEYHLDVNELNIKSGGKNEPNITTKFS